MRNCLSNISGAWSAAPTPFTKSLKVDATAIKRMVKRHINLGQKGMFIGGTCGEGPWMPRQDLRHLTSLVTESNNGQMTIAVQVTDNSFAKVLANIADAKSDGADIAVIAEPWFAGPRDVVMEQYYMTVAEKSPLPLGVYSRGAANVPFDIYRRLLIHPNVYMFKDSSCNDELMRLALSIKSKKNSLALMCGYELGMVPYLAAGYDGILAGGGILIGALVTKMVEAVKNGDIKKAEKLQRHCDKINYAAYGGKKITSWLTGLKYTLVRMGIFNTTDGYLQYPLPKVEQQKINKMIKSEKDTLLL
jgi:4-hydroxy-tetrahydrodipicolinate synthase